jgi:predicted mannosyl-3-phosphoglycerate phosphatase (HAD superfamily)
MSERKHDMPKPEEISVILAAVSKELPSLVKGIVDSFFSPKAAADMGKSVATFYKTLKEGGIPEDQALAMTREYLGTLTKWSESLKGMKIGQHEG